MRKIYGFKLEACFSQCILNLCPNVRLGVTSALTFLSLEHKRWVFIPLFMELRFDGLYSRGAAIGRRSISGILLALAPLVPSCLGACIWKMKAKHHKKLPGRLHRPRNRRAVDLASDNGQPQTLERESYTGPSNGKYEPWKLYPGWLSTFQFASCLIVYCECEWVYLALMQLVTH